MNPNKRTLINVIAQYLRTIINIILSLYSTRLVLDALGVDDYGIFMLVGGVIAMLTFIINSMVITTQRFLSFYYGKKDNLKVKTYFNNSLVLNALLVLALVMILAVFAILFFHKLNINPDRMDVAYTVFYILTFNLIIAFITAPFRAVFIARENIVFISVIDVLDGVSKVLLVIYMLPMFSDKLLSYSLILTGVFILNFMAFAFTAALKYEEVSLLPKKKFIKWNVLKKMFGFAGWTTYATGCLVGRAQGIAIILNTAFGTVINAAYGIAMQVSGSVNFLAQAIINAMSPRVVKAEGSGDRDEMIKLANKTSKFCFLLLSMFAIPIIFEMPDILNFWLGSEKASDNAIMFCRFILIAAVADQITTGLGVANQAIGKIRNYTLLINSIKLSTLLFVAFAIFSGYPVIFAMWCYLTIEILCAILRIVYMNKAFNIPVYSFFSQVLYKIVMPTFSVIMVAWGCSSFLDFKYRFIVTVTLAVVVDVCVIVIFALEEDEKHFMKRLFKKKYLEVCR